MSHRISRRDVLKAAAGSAAALALTPFVHGADSASRPLSGRALRVGYIRQMGSQPDLLDALGRRDDVRLVALGQDIPTALWDRPLVEYPWWRRQSPRLLAAGRTATLRMFAMNLDAVVLDLIDEDPGLPIAALRCGKAVLAATSQSCDTVEGAHHLVAAQRDSGAAYMQLRRELLEPDVITVQAMVERGAFGELTYASGGAAEGYRRSLARQVAAPLCRWMGINRNDRLAQMVARRERDTVHVLIRTVRGRLLELRNPALPEVRMVHVPTLSLHGTRGAYRRTKSGPSIHLQGRTVTQDWEPLALRAPHLVPASDCPGKPQIDRAVDRFVRLARRTAGGTPSRPASVDVLDAVTWSVLDHLVEQSISAGSKVIAFPTFA